MLNRTFTESELTDCSRHGRARLKFPPALESAYRGSQDRRYRWARLLFFVTCALTFFTAPLYDQALFMPRPELKPILFAIECLLVAPVLLLAGLVQFRPLGRNARYAIHIAAVCSLWGACLALHGLSLLGGLDYPPHLVNIAVAGAAIFGGFRIILILVGGTVATGLSLMLFAGFHDAQQPLSHFVYETAFFWLISSGGALTIDLLNRESWLARARVRAMARMDRMTGLLNRGAFNDAYERAIALAARDRRWVAVALIDVDHFKTFNDRHGHLKGDEALAAVGQALLSVRPGRPMDLRARYGGEEFIAVWYDLNPEGLPAFADLFLEAIRGIRLLDHRGQPLALTASVGAVAAIPGRGGDGAVLIRAADERLYAAKRAGRNQAVVSQIGNAN